MQFGSSAEGVQIGRRGGGGLRRGREPKKRDTQRLCSVAVRRDGYGRDRRWGSKCARGSSQRQPRARNARRRVDPRKMSAEPCRVRNHSQQQAARHGSGCSSARWRVDPRGRRPRNPAGSKTIVSSRLRGAAAALLRRVRVEIRPVGGSATEASGGGVGARGGKSDGVASKGTAKTGVKVASAASPNAARSWRSSPVPTKAETRATNLPVGA